MQRFEYVIWGLPKDSTDPIDEKVLYTQAKNEADIERVKERAAQIRLALLSYPDSGFERYSRFFRPKAH
jgi:hypothetical protein